MFGKPLNQHLKNNDRFGKVDTPSVSEETLEKYRDMYNRVTEGIERPNVLVLGATPELRDIVLEQGHALTCIERDTEALAYKTSLMHYKQDPNETVLTADWLTVELAENSFDVVMGDGSLTMLPQTKHEELLTVIHGALKPTGNLVLREGTVVPTRPRYSPATHIHEYRTGQYSIFDLFFGLRLYNDSFESIDDATRRSDLQKFDHKINEYYNDGLLSKLERDSLHALADELEHTLLHKEDLEEVLRHYFFPKEIIHDIGSGHLSPWYFFLMQPNDQIELPEHVPTERYDYVREFLASQTD